MLTPIFVGVEDRPFYQGAEYSLDLAGFYVSSDFGYVIPKIVEHVCIAQALVACESLSLGGLRVTYQVNGQNRTVEVS